jgi:hypothetical protein
MKKQMGVIMWLHHVACDGLCQHLVLLSRGGHLDRSVLYVCMACIDQEWMRARTLRHSTLYVGDASASVVFCPMAGCSCSHGMCVGACAGQQ